MKLALFGYGGHAREVAAQIGQEVTFYVDDKYANDIAQPISSFDPTTHTMMVAVGDSVDRAQIVSKLPKETQYFTFVHPTAQLMDSNITLGEGSFVGAGCILTTNIQLGKHTLLNRGNQIGHDTVSGDFFSMMPCAVVGGNVTFGDKVYMGSCSNVREGITIASDVTIGMNAAVVKDIDTTGVYIGVPAKRLR